MRLGFHALRALGVFSIVSAVTVADAQIGPDVTVLRSDAIQKWGTVGDITGYSLASTSCNRGDMTAIWIPNTNQHPLIGQQMYRLLNGRLEQIGMSWLKHAFCAVNEPGCMVCQDTPCDSLGIGCADTYGTGLNGEQGNLGPRSDVNAATGGYDYPFPTAGDSGDAIYKRLQIHNDDLNPALNPNAIYFGEVQYLTTDEQVWGNQYNNVSYRQVIVGDLSTGGYILEYQGATVEERTAVEAWRDFDPEVTVEDVFIAGDGRMVLGYKVTDLGGGQYHYEYALYNMNSDRSGQSFSIPVPPGVNVSNIGFHDVDYHSGEPYRGADWTVTLSSGLLTWSTETFQENPDANALRWSTTYNFRFDADSPPQSVNSTIGLFKPGPTPAVTVPTVGPESAVLAAAFSAAPTSGGAPLVVQFNDLSGGAIDAWSWDFGDGTGDTAQNPAHVYTQPGQYTVQLMITGPSGSDTVTIPDLIDVGVPVHVLRVERQNALAGSAFSPFLLGSSDLFLGGFSASLAYPTDLLDGVDFNLVGSVAAANGAEFVQSQVIDTAGEITIEVIMDEPPLDGNSIPAGVDQHFATMVFEVDGAFVEGETRELTFVDGLGAIPVDNLFSTLGGVSFRPVTEDATITFLNQALFIRSDCDATGTINIADPILLLNVLFSGAIPPACVKACDFDDTGALNLGDAILILQLIFQSGQTPPPPFPEAGPDPTPDGLPCF